MNSAGIRVTGNSIASPPKSARIVTISADSLQNSSLNQRERWKFNGCSDARQSAAAGTNHDHAEDRHKRRNPSNCTQQRQPEHFSGKTGACGVTRHRVPPPAVWLSHGPAEHNPHTPPLLCIFRQIFRGQVWKTGKNPVRICRKGDKYVRTSLGLASVLLCQSGTQTDSPVWRHADFVDTDPPPAPDYQEKTILVGKRHRSRGDWSDLCGAQFAGRRAGFEHLPRFSLLLWRSWYRSKKQKRH